MNKDQEERTQAELFSRIVEDALSGDGKALYIIGQMDIELKQRESSDPNIRDYMNRWRQGRKQSPKAQLISSQDNIAKYRLSNGEAITISLDDFANSIEVKNASGDIIGNMDVRVIENDRGPDEHRITNMYLNKHGDQYKKQGIGRACIEHYNNAYGVTLKAAKNDGQTQDDGSHLTGDAIGFIAAMRRDGLVE